MFKIDASFPYNTVGFMGVMIIFGIIVMAVIPFAAYSNMKD